MRIRRAECLLFFAIVASAGALQVHEHLAAPELRREPQPDAQRLVPCATAQAGLLAAACGEAGVEAPQRTGTRPMQHIALWV